MTGRGRVRGVSAVETLIALPILLGLGLGTVQFALVFQAKHALNHALIEAARAGSVAHAEPEAILRGLAFGLMPWLYGARDLGEYARNQARAVAHLAEAQAMGWLLVEQVSPGPASFDDWAEPARDVEGGLMAGVREIPNDSLVHRATRTEPTGGAVGSRSGEPIGSASGQTLADANLLRLRVDYGVPLAVPVVGRMIAWSLRAWDGCEAARPRRYGLLLLDAPPAGSEPRGWTCAMYGADTDGSRPRIPVRLSATLRMQSPARHTGSAFATTGATDGPASPERPVDRPIARDAAGDGSGRNPVGLPPATGYGSVATGRGSADERTAESAAEGVESPGGVRASGPSSSTVPLRLPRADAAFCSGANG